MFSDFKLILNQRCIGTRVFLAMLTCVARSDFILALVLNTQHVHCTYKHMEMPHKANYCDLEHLDSRPLFAIVLANFMLTHHKL